MTKSVCTLDMHYSGGCVDKFEFETLEDGLNHLSQIVSSHSDVLATGDLELNFSAQVGQLPTE